MKNLIMAVDFDGTIVQDAYPQIGSINMKTVEYIRRHQNQGTKLVLWTCRSGQQLEEAIMVCTGLGIKFDAINDNLPEIKAKYGNNSRKVYADIYLDDRAFIPVEKYTEEVKIPGPTEVEVIEMSLQWN